jgi:hypothetical protein
MAESGRFAWNVPVFVVGGKTIGVGHVVAAAHCRGELQEAWNTFLATLEGEKQAAAPDDDGEPEADEEELQSLSEQFRYDRDLITAEDTERWLADRGLTLDDFNAYFLRHYWASTLEEPPETEPVEYFTASDALWNVLAAELHLSGEFDRMAERLSWRFAAVLEPGSDPTSPAESGAVEGGAGLEAWLARLGCDRQWLADVRVMEAAFRRRCEQLLTQSEVERALTSMRLPLMRVNLETVDVESLDAVRELAMCVREDGMSMAEVASDARYPYERTEVVLEDLPTDVQQKVLFAAPGDVLPPLPHDGGFYVHRLVARSDPDLADDDIRERVERQILTRHFAGLTTSCVRWLLAPVAAS